MLNFLRKIRRKNMNGKYIKYAIGEIFLVVIGILIALQINTWSEQNKNKKIVEGLKKSLVKDLGNDIRSITENLEYMLNDSVRMSVLARRLSAPGANYDTLVKIARYEFSPWYIGSQEFNNATYQSLINTGRIELLDRDLILELSKLNAKHLEYVQAQVASDKMYLETFIAYSDKYSFVDANNEIKGRLQDELWKNVDPKQLLRDFNGLMGKKQIMFTNLIGRRREVLNQTKKVLEMLKPK